MTMVKYYLYISDAKVNMLLPQIPNKIKKKIATEFKIDFKIISASRKTETDTDENRISRLNTVCQFIQDYSDVGTIEKPGEYIFDILEMKYAIFPRRPIVVFWGRTEQSFIALSGSSEHLVGVPPHFVADIDIGSSHLHGIMSSLHHILSEESKVKALPKLKYENNANNVWRLLSLENIIEEPKQKIEFLAKRLLVETSSHSGSTLIVGSPLYVALAD
jgi:hypothetical protein